MTTLSTEYTAYILELLEPIGHVQTGRFFGGVGIFNGIAQFAMIMGNSLYVVVDKNPPHEIRASGHAAVFV